MNYWDSSALVTLFIDQPQSPKYLEAVRLDPRVITTWHAIPECASAFCRLQREGLLKESEVDRLYQRLEERAKSWFVVAPGKQVERLTLRCLRVHPLRAMDAIHLGAARLVRGEDGASMTLFTEDRRLREAAGKEGFMVDR